MPRRKPTERPAPETCPVCGEDVPRKALACPECGADYNSGWSDEAAYDGLDLPVDSFDYPKFVQQEFDPSHSSGMHTAWWITGVILILAFAILYFCSAR
ncbi:MAG: zinc ribbon domain-containing protein [Alphaproteobacteria bacterium]